METIFKMIKNAVSNAFYRHGNHMTPLLAAIPVSLVLDALNASGIILFLVSCLAVIPLASLLGDSAEEVSSYAGPKLGGLITATTGNIPELCIGIFSIKAGMFELVKTGIVGSIAGNMLLVLGMSILAGGMKYKFQSFDRIIARTNFGLLFLALVGFIIPAAYKYLGSGSSEGLTYLSVSVSAVLLVIYILGLVFSFWTHRNLFIKSEDDISEKSGSIGIKKSMFILAAAAAGTAYEANLLVRSIESVKTVYGIPEAFLGIVIVPVIGNIAEYTSSVMMAMKDKINISIEIAIGSSMQMAMFVAPCLALLSFFGWNAVPLVLNSFELVTVACSIGLSLYIFQDGRTNWLEGVELVSAYVIVALAYFFMR